MVKPSSTFPYLRVAKRYGVSYAAVLWYADKLECSAYPELPKRVPNRLRHLECFQSSRWWNDPWATATTAAVIIERMRRAEQRRHA